MRNATVHIIESPSADDIFNGQHEGATLKSALAHAGISSSVRTAVDLRHFATALSEVMGAHDGAAFPIVQLSMHGNETGVGLTSNEVFTWKALGGALCDVNEALDGMLLVVMSTCAGFNGVGMAHRDVGDPFFALVGPKENLGWGDTVAAFTGFYHHVIARELSIVSGVKAMNAVLGDEAFACERGEVAKKKWQAAKGAEERFRKIAERVAAQESLSRIERSEALRHILDSGDRP